MARRSPLKKSLFQAIAALSLAGLFLALIFTLCRRIFSSRED